MAFPYRDLVNKSSTVPVIKPWPRPVRVISGVIVLACLLLSGCSGVPTDAPRLMHRLEEALREPSNATGLVLSQSKLKEAPPEIARLKALKGLDLSENELTTLPESFSELSELELLDLRSNRLTNIPPVLARMPGLRRLYLSDNQLSSIQHLPPGLEELYLSQNELKELAALPTNLRLLHLADNKLEASDELARLIRLEELNVSNNRLQSLPAGFSRLDRLQTLIAKNNRLTELGFEPTSNHRLFLVQLEGNPIPLPLQARLKKQQPRAEWRFSSEPPEEGEP
ncbi:leucine-rich repeat domain-containing protein [bacterium CPR1]|nr:leucine-rich repeat domain-containing protein [bacterium CPR1]